MEIEGGVKEARFSFGPRILHSSVHIVHCNMESNGICILDNINVSCNLLFLFFNSTTFQLSVIRPASCCHHPKKTKVPHLHSWKRYFGRGSRKKGGSLVVTNSLRSVKYWKSIYSIILPGAEMLAAVLQVSQWTNKTVYSVWNCKWVSDGFVLPEEMNWLTERLLLAAQQMSNIAGSLGEGEG